MPRLTNSFEGGSDGVTISSANSGGGSGDAVDSTFFSGAANAQYDNARSAVGSQSALFTAASGEVSQMEWNATSWASKTESWVRAYVNFDTVSLTNHVAVLVLADGASAAAEVQLRNSNVLGLRDSAFTLRFSSSTTISADTWYRIEWHVVHDTTNGHMEARLFHGANLHGSTPDETFGNLTNNYNTLASADEMRWGIGANPGASGSTMWFDELAVDDTAWIGPAGAAYPAAVSNLQAVAASATQIDLSWDALAGAGAYDIERDGTVIVTDHSGTTYNDMGLAPDTEYDYRVRGVP